MISVISAIWSLALLTMERTWVIHSISRNRNTRVSMTKMRSIVITIWIAAVLTGLAPLIGWNRYVYEVGQDTFLQLYETFIIVQYLVQGYLLTSTIDYLSKSGGDLSLVWVMMVVAYVFPSVFIMGGNAIILQANRYVWTFGL